jgi:hypothetical protein
MRWSVRRVSVAIETAMVQVSPGPGRKITEV